MADLDVLELLDPLLARVLNCLPEERPFLRLVNTPSTVFLLPYKLSVLLYHSKGPMTSIQKVCFSIQVL